VIGFLGYRPNQMHPGHGSEARLASWQGERPDTAFARLHGQRAVNRSTDVWTRGSVPSSPPSREYVYISPNPSSSFPLLLYFALSYPSHDAQQNHSSRDHGIQNRQLLRARLAPRRPLSTPNIPLFFCLFQQSLRPSPLRVFVQLARSDS
jgi:hypothetical protein